MAGALTAIAGPSQAVTAPGWRITAVLPNNSTVTGLAATGAGDAWAAATVCANASCQRNTLLVRRWNGKAWTAISVPKAYVNSSAELGASAVAATSADSAWIMDTIQTTTQNTSTAVLHWTGRGWGTTVKLPVDVLAAVAPAAKDAWAFGVASTSASSFGPSYAAHYDGKKWSPVRVPVAGIRASATSASDIWVAGFSAASSLPAPAAAIMDFNGKTWRTTPLPNLGLSSKQVAIPMGIAAVSAANVWADGVILGTSSPTNPAPKPFLLHWNGRKWAAIKVPYTGFTQGSLSQDGHGGVWMSVIPLGNGLPGGYLLHYGNGAWTRVAAPARKGEITMPGTLAWIPGTRSVWGAGTEIPAGPNLTASPSVIYKYGA